MSNNQPNLGNIDLFDHGHQVNSFHEEQAHFSEDFLEADQGYNSFEYGNPQQLTNPMNDKSSFSHPSKLQCLCLVHYSFLLLFLNIISFF